MASPALAAILILFLGLSQGTFAGEPSEDFSPEQSEEVGHGEAHAQPEVDSEGKHAQDHAEHGDHHAVPSWSELAVPLSLRLLNFAIFTGLLVFVLRKPVKKYLESRRKTVTEAIESAQERKAWAEQKFSEYQKRLENIGTEINALKASLEKEGKFESEKILAQAKQHAEAIRRDASLIAQADWEELREELRREAIERAAEVARETILHTFQKEDQERFTQEFLEVLRREGRASSKGNA